MIPVILSGGSGNRLWPISRKNNPKQFCDFLDDSLLGITLERLANFKEPIIISNTNLRDLTENSISEQNKKIQSLYEPVARNTGPAVALVTKYLEDKKMNDEWVGVFPADHLISPQLEFDSILKSVENLDDEYIYLIGIKPTEPKTGYGYIEVDDIQINQACKVSKFHEKPSPIKAQEYLDSGNYLWNSGIFIFKPKTLIKYFEVSESELWKDIKKITDYSNFSEIYKKLNSISFDHDVLEKFNKIKCIPASLKWSDVGTWDEFSKVIDPHDSFDREVVEVNANNNFYFSREKKVITAIDVDDLIIVDSADSLLVCKKGSSEKVKESLTQIKDLSVTEDNNLVLKPWGSFKVLLDSKDCKVKRINVFAGHRLSYQSHKKRDEYWTVIAGEGEVTLGGEVSTLKVGQSICVPAAQKHRIANKSDKLLQFIEVQTGEYFGEDDIERYEDDYGRA